MTPKSKLDAVQLSHGLHRLSALYSSLTNPLVVQPTNARATIDWCDATAVATFVERYNLPAPSWREIGQFMLTSSLPTDFFKRVDGALRAEYADRNKNRSIKLEKADACLGKAQDSLIYGDVSTAAEVTTFLTKFSSDLRAILA